jgi:hypothetical protein
MLLGSSLIRKPARLLRALVSSARPSRRFADEKEGASHSFPRRHAYLLGMASALALTLANPLYAQVDSTSGSSLTIQVNGTEVARFVPNGISSSGVVQVSGTSLVCGSSINGAMRWSSTSNTLQICVGSIWTSLSSNTTAPGANAMAGLSDVTLTNLAGRDYLRYDAGTSKW